MPVVGCLVMPHGTLVLDPSKPVYNDELNKSMVQAAEDLAALRPDLILLSTPHGLAHDVDFGFYLNRRAEGNAGWLGEYEDYRADLELDRALTLELRDHLQKRGMRAAGITSAMQTTSAPLKWGEAVPLWFIENALKKEKEKSSAPSGDRGDEGASGETNADGHSVKYVIMSQPSRRWQNEREMMPELRELGEAVSSFFQERSERVAIVISSDLAHTHAYPSAPYPFSPSAKPFDEAVEEWARTLDPAALDQAGELAATALSCGFSGLVFLDGLLRHHNHLSQVALTPKVYANLAPTYFGMLTASYLPSSS